MGETESDAVDLRSAHVVVVANGRANDYYAGDNEAVYVDGRLVWSGYTCDHLGDVVSALAGRQVLVENISRPDEPWPEVLEAADW